MFPTNGVVQRRRAARTADVRVRPVLQQQVHHCGVTRRRGPVERLVGRIGTDGLPDRGRVGREYVGRRLEVPALHGGEQAAVDLASTYD